MRELIVQEALSWVRTPYHGHGRIKGVGVDCAMLLAEVYELTGLIEHVEAGNYSVDFHLHQRDEVYRGWLSRYADQVGLPLPGDVVLFRFGRVGSHAGIVIDWPVIVHAYLRDGVVLEDVISSGRLAHRVDSFWCVRGVS